MILEAIRLFLAIAILVILPGWLLMRALFPRPEDIGPLERTYVVVAGGIFVLMFIGIILGFLPHAGSKGALQSLALDGMPNVELAVLGSCGALAWIAMARGGLPWLAARVPTSWLPRLAAGAPGRSP